MLTVDKTKTFIDKCNKVHDYFYDYSLVVYIGCHDKIDIICPEHGEFKQSPNSHKSGNGCPECSKAKERKTSEKFITESIEVHGDYYGYSKVVYISNRKSVIIICPEHGDFEQVPYSHLQGKGCLKCSIENKKYTTEIFIDKGNEVHNYFYTYEKVNYVHNNTQVTITCPNHGYFDQRPRNHLSGQGCPDCAIESHSLTTEEVIQRCVDEHGDEYDYSEVVYIDKLTNIHIICRKHGSFWQNPMTHFGCVGNKGAKCPKCANIARRSDTEEFVEKSLKIHNGFYGYSLVDYINCSEKVDIICPLHGVFKQTPSKHLTGAGCSICNASKGEILIAKILTKIEVNFLREYKLDGHRYRYDFFLHDYNILLEFHGIQHFEVREFFGGQEGFKETQIRDKKKVKLANYKNKPLIVVTYLDLELGDDKFEEILLLKIKEARERV